MSKKKYKKIWLEDEEFMALIELLWEGGEE